MRSYNQAEAVDGGGHAYSAATDTRNTDGNRGERRKPEWPRRDEDSPICDFCGRTWGCIGANGISNPSQRCFRYDASKSYQGIDTLRPRKGDITEDNVDLRFSHYCYQQQASGVVPPAMDIKAFRKVSLEQQLSAGRPGPPDRSHAQGGRANVSATFQGVGDVDMSPQASVCAS